MPRKLKLLKPKAITAIAFCDRGANPEAHITIFKRDTSDLEKVKDPGFFRECMKRGIGPGTPEFCAWLHHKLTGIWPGEHKSQKADFQKALGTLSDDDIKAAVAEFEEVSKRIVRRGNKHCVVTEDGKRTLGCHPTRAEALRQLAAIEANKSAAPAGTVRRVIEAVGKALGWTADQVQKAFGEATTFGEMREQHQIERVVAEVNRAGWDLIDAISRTLRDEDAEDKGALIRTSLSQFVSFVEGALPTWLQGQTVEKGDAPIAKLEAARAALDTLLGSIRETPDNGTTTTTPPEATMPDVKKNDDPKKATEPGAAPAGSQDGANLDEVLKGLTPEARAAVLELKKAAEDAAKRAQEAEKLAKAERDARELAEIRKMVEQELDALPGTKPEEFAPVIKAAREKLTAEEYKAIEDALKAANVALRKSELFVVRGSDGQAGDAMSKLVAKAEELQKADPKLTRAQAIDKASQMYPDLVAEYRREFAKRSA